MQELVCVVKQTTPSQPLRKPQTASCHLLRRYNSYKHPYRYRTEQAEHSKVITTDNHNHTWKYNFALSPTLQNSCPFASPKRLFSVNVNSGVFKENIGTFLANIKNKNRQYLRKRKKKLTYLNSNRTVLLNF